MFRFLSKIFISFIHVFIALFCQCIQRCEPRKTSPISLGLRMNTEHAFRLVDRGPNPSDTAAGILKYYIHVYIYIKIGLWCWFFTYLIIIYSGQDI